MDEKEILHSEILKTNELAHQLDKKLAILVLETQNINQSIGEIETDIGDIRQVIDQLERKQLDFEYYMQAKKKRVNFFLKNWRLISTILVLLFGLYEGAKYLLYLKPPGPGN